MQKVVRKEHTPLSSLQECPACTTTALPVSFAILSIKSKQEVLNLTEGYTLAF